MNKKLLTAVVVSALTASPAAFSAVTVSGHLDVGIQSVDPGEGYDGSELFVGGNYGSGGSLLSFGVNEDLGGGLKAIGRAEIGMNSDDGLGDDQASTGLFQRQIYAGLTGAFGTATIGRQYREAFLVGSSGAYNYTAGAIGVFFMNTAVGVRQSNFIKYASPSLGGFTIVGGYAPGEGTTLATEPNEFVEFGVKYAGGPIRGGLVTHTTTSGTTDTDVVILAGQWSFGPATVYAQYSTAETSPVSIDVEVLSLGGKFTVGNGDIVLQLSQRELSGAGVTDADSFLAAVSYVHRLSKTTMTYVSYGTLDNDANVLSNLPRQAVTTTDFGQDPSALFAGMRIIF